MTARQMSKSRLAGAVRVPHLAAAFYARTMIIPVEITMLDVDFAPGEDVIEGCIRGGVRMFLARYGTVAVARVGRAGGRSIAEHCDHHPPPRYWNTPGTPIRPGGLR